MKVSVSYEKCVFNVERNDGSRRRYIIEVVTSSCNTISTNGTIRVRNKN